MRRRKRGQLAASNTSSQVDLMWVLIICFMAMVLGLISLAKVVMAETQKELEEAQRELEEAREQRQEAVEERGKMGEALLKRLNPSMLHDWFSYLPGRMQDSEPNVVYIGDRRFQGSQYEALLNVHWEIYLGDGVALPRWWSGGTSIGIHGPAKASGTYGEEYEALENMKFHGNRPDDEEVLYKLVREVKLCLFYQPNSGGVLINGAQFSREEFETLVREHIGLFIYLNDSSTAEDPAWLQDLWRREGISDLGTLEGMWKGR